MAAQRPAQPAAKPPRAPKRAPVPTSAPTSAPNPTPAPARAIYYASPLLLGVAETCAAHLKRMAALGFDTLLIAPPSRPGLSGNLFDIAEPDRLHPLLGDGPVEDYLADLARAAAAQGLALFVDLVTDHLAAESSLVAANPDLFHQGGANDGLPPDPRRPLARPDAAFAHFGSPAAERQALALFGPMLRRWADA